MEVVLQKGQLLADIPLTASPAGTSQVERRMEGTIPDLKSEREKRRLTHQVCVCTCSTDDLYLPTFALPVPAHSTLVHFVLGREFSEGVGNMTHTAVRKTLLEHPGVV